MNKWEQYLITPQTKEDEARLYQVRLWDAEGKIDWRQVDELAANTRLSDMVDWKRHDFQRLKAKYRPGRREWMTFLAIFRIEMVNIGKKRYFGLQWG